MPQDTTITVQANATLNLYQGLTKHYLDAAIPAALTPALQAALLPLQQGLTAMATVLEDLVREVQESRTVTESAIILLNGLKAALDAAIAAGDMSAVQAAVNDLDAQQAALAAAITANTPAA